MTQVLRGNIIQAPRLGELDMWEGDRYFLPLVFDPQIGQFICTLNYRSEQLTVS